MAQAQRPASGHFTEIANVQDDGALLARIRSTLKKNIYHAPPGDKRILPNRLCHDFYDSMEPHPQFGSIRVVHTKVKRRELMLEYCRKLYDVMVTDEADDPLQGHFERLDACFMELFTLKLVLNVDEKQTIDSVARDTEHVLRRLPPWPLKLPDMPADLSVRYFDAAKPNQLSEGMNDEAVWSALSVVSKLSTNIIRIALIHTIYPSIPEEELVDLAAELLTLCCSIEHDILASNQNDRTDLHRWFVIRAFLWTFWQQGQMLLFHRRLNNILYGGASNAVTVETTIRLPKVTPHLTIQQYSDQTAHLGKSHYMCSWAFTLLRTDPAGVGSDFRLFHSRYNKHFGHKPGRCISQAPGVCDGRDIRHCGRSETFVEDQSMHDVSCDGKCPKLVWDEQSYRKAERGRVVDIATTDLERHIFRYKTASETSLAISHVWAHGQGGRPHMGLNECLHLRYVSAAKKLGCDSYFMDTPCIPDDKELKKEAIKNINQTYANSKHVLIADMDFLSIDASKIDIELQESLLATILVCDWNVRAWTLLEAMRGRKNLLVLLAGGVTVSVLDMCRNVFQHGRIDLSIMTLMAIHVLPWSRDLIEGEVNQAQVDWRLEYPTIEFAGSLLSFRPASQGGDDVLIWSLLNNQSKLTGSSEEFWRSRVGTRVQGGFLISSAPRLGVKGFSWAPTTPNVASNFAISRIDHQNVRQDSDQYYRSFASSYTDLLTITDRGLEGNWFVHEFEAFSTATTLSSKLRPLSIKQTTRAQPSKSPTEQELDKIRNKFLVGYRYGNLLQAVSIKTSGTWLDYDDRIAKYPGRIEGTTLVAVLGSKTNTWSEFWSPRKDGLDMKDWVWRGVHEWPADVALPEFKEAWMLLI